MAEGREAITETRLVGIGVSPGIVRARARFVRGTFTAPPFRLISEQDIPEEKARFRAAIEKTREQIAAMRTEIDESVGTEHASIFDAHLLLLEDAAVIDEVMRILETERRNIDRIYYEIIRRYVDSLRKIEDAYLRERAIDIEDVAGRVLLNLELGDAERRHEGEDDDTRIVLVAHDLTPSDTVAINRRKVLGFATEAGSPTSHTAIMARSLNIPAVVGLHGLRQNLESGADLLLDGYNGLLIVSPSDETLAEYEILKARKVALLEDLKQLRDAETKTADGRPIVLSANIEFKKEVPLLIKQGAEGVGLYRTEFFFLNQSRRARSEERQMENYAYVADAVRPHGVIIRTLDVGGDKVWPDRYTEPEPNPFLGLRGIRVSLEDPKLFKTQLRAILRAAVHGKVGVMYPFVSRVEELRRANALLEEARQELQAEGVEHNPDIEVGVMIEIPSAALMADSLAREVDFFSIGTNDLIQYTTAVDRVNERVSDLYDPANPAIMRLIHQVVEAAHRNKIWVGVCGEMAGDILLMPMLVGLGIDELSVGAVQLLRVRRAISRLDTISCRDLVNDLLLHAECSDDILDRCRQVAEEHYPELMS